MNGIDYAWCDRCGNKSPDKCVLCVASTGDNDEIPSNFLRKKKLFTTEADRSLNRKEGDV